MGRFRFLFFLAFFLVMLLGRISADVVAPRDQLSIEAMIGNHKAVTFAMDIKMVTEIGVEKYHEETKKKIKDYKAINDTLDRYRRCFNVLNMVLSGAATAYRTVVMLNRSKDNIEGMVKLLDHYQKNFLTKLNVETSDTVIITICNDCIKDLRQAIPGLYKSYASIGTYFTGVTECTTSNLLTTFQGINTSLDELDAALSGAYSRLWYYMMIRSFYYKREIFASYSVKQILDAAFGSWMQAARDVGEEIRSQTPHATRQRKLGGGGLFGERRRQEGGV